MHSGGVSFAGLTIQLVPKVHSSWVVQGAVYVYQAKVGYREMIELHHHTTAFEQSTCSAASLTLLLHLSSRVVSHRYILHRLLVFQYRLLYCQHYNTYHPRSHYPQEDNPCPRLFSKASYSPSYHLNFVPSSTTLL